VELSGAQRVRQSRGGYFSVSRGFIRSCFLAKRSTVQTNAAHVLTMADRRFPPPWTVEDIGAAFVVKDCTGQRLAYVYFEEEPGARSTRRR
jgi:hypothetical protein